MIETDIIDTVIEKMKNCFHNESEHFSMTRDVFTARLQSYILAGKKYLEAAVIGEIGNNTFDHNFVFELQFPRGVYCNLSYKDRYVIIADYGRGVKGSLLPVVSSISTDLEAVEMAFTRQISGRTPEQRGNGLKFVSKAVQQNQWHLFFQSGNGTCSINKNGLSFLESSVSLTGCLAIISFNDR
ncbi:MAG: hypothetical protein LBB89_04425 [Treponema sp.]|jgi:hypothetical protein|nr:hypothetical protein [Treponema sp.]